MSSLALSRATAARVTAASPGLRQRLLAGREPQAEDHIRRYLGRQSDARWVALGFGATGCGARRQNSLQLPTHEATPTSA